MSRTIFLAVLALIFAVSVQASSSSTGVPSVSSSSSYFTAASTGSTGSPDAYPSNSFAVVFQVTFTTLVTSANVAQAAISVKSDIAVNYANLTGTNATQVQQFIVITAINGINLAPSARRLLQANTTPQNVAYVLLGNITQTITSFNIAAAVNSFVSAASNGTLTAPSSGSVPKQTITTPTPVGSTPVSSSSGVGANGASSIVASPVAVLFAAVASMALLL